MYLNKRDIVLSVLLVICSWLIKQSDGHVALTFPPARKYDLDFLDNGRTKAPCGMPKGDLRTSLPQGAQLNITWHLSYPHRGGFKLELLDAEENHMLDLTPATNSAKYVGMEDSTAQSYTVTFPRELTCKECTLRLVRQAQEWGQTYLFWSCADIDVVSPMQLTSICSGHGSLKEERCDCQRLYSGNICQYKDECWQDTDCGSHGQCVNVDATTYPKMQCYCEPGWFGEKCSKESPIKSIDVDLATYMKRSVSSEVTLYWKILKESQELETVMKVKGSSYAAIGWRPEGMTSECKAFPVVDAKKAVPSYSNSLAAGNGVTRRVRRQANDLNAVTADPAATSEPKPEPEPTSEPPSSEPEPSSEPPSAEPEPTSEPPSAEPEPSSEPPSSEPEPSSEPPSSEPEPSSEPPSSEPEPFSEPPSSEPEPSSEPPSSEPEPSSEPPSSEPEPSSEPPSSEPEPSSEPPSSEPEPSSEAPSSEPEPSSEPPSSEPEPSSEPPSSEPEPSSEPPSSEPEPSSEPPSSEPEPSSKTPKSEPEPSSEPPSSEPEPTSEPPSSEPEPTSEPPSSEPEPSSEPPSSEPEPSSEPPSSEPEPSSKIPKSEPEPSSEPPSSEPEPSSGTPKSEPEPSSEPPSSEPEPSSITPKSEPEPTSEPPSSEPEPSSEPPSSEPEPSSEPQPKSENIARDPSVARKLGDSKTVYPARSPYTPRPRNEFHAMDCTDIVIGSARGGVGRVFDYYTRDRSTPKKDSFYGGGDDLTAAIAKEVDGETTIIFRKKLTATELTDHSIVDAPMHLIWARGQEPGKYFHRPTTGLEAGKAKIPDFYRPDELKYHGHGSQRGKLTLNFYEDPMKVRNEITPCTGAYYYPPSCSGADCVYSATWRFIEKTDEISFIVQSKHADRWTGIAFSKDDRMAGSDAVIGWVDPTGRITVYDTFISGYTAPTLDASQDVYNISGERQNGITTLRFVRRRLNADFDQDLHFTDNDCLHFFFPVTGGSYNAVSKRIGIHIETPKVSSQKICVRSCKPGEKGVPEPEPHPKGEPEPHPKGSPEPHPKKELEPDYKTYCKGEFKHPAGCFATACVYSANWEYVDKYDAIKFTISSSNFNKWTGIGFSKNKAMLDTDAILGWVDENGRPFIMDTWLETYSAPSLDSAQNIVNRTGKKEDGITTLSFVRKRNTGDFNGDLHFTDAECLYMVYPIKGGVFNAVNKKIRRHEATPMISEEKICIRSCEPKAPSPEPEPVPGPSPTVPIAEPPVGDTTPPVRRYPSTPTRTRPPTTTTTLPPPLLPEAEFQVRLKLAKVKESVESTRDYQKIRKKLAEDVNDALSQLDGYKGIRRIELTRPAKDPSTVFANINIVMIDPDIPVKDGRELDLVNQQMEKMIKDTLNDTVGSGKIGNIPVDPGYLVVSSISGNEGVSNEIPIDDEIKTAGLTDEQIKIYIIIGGVCALGLLVLIQASCMIHRDRAMRKNVVNKEKLIANSHWKDYSATASSNYSYENFAMRDEDGKPSKHSVSSVPNGNGSAKALSNGASEASHTNGKSNGHKSHHHHGRPMPPLNGYPPSATFERGSKRSDGMSNFSGYSNAYATHDRSARSANRKPELELTPDFYFMPHQRRYSGEVVRVYVDYNNPEFTNNK